MSKNENKCIAEYCDGTFSHRCADCSIGACDFSDYGLCDDCLYNGSGNCCLNFIEQNGDAE